MICGKGFVEEEALSLHKKDMHEVKCNECEYVCYTDYDLTMHKSANHSTGTSYKTSAVIQGNLDHEQHTSTLSQTRPTTKKLELECEFCPYVTNKAIKFMKHVKSHNTHFACNKCPFTSCSEFAFEVHMQNDHSPTKKPQQNACFPCSTCGMIFLDKKDLMEHTKRQHKTVEEVNLEDSINESNENKQHEVDEMFKCDKCKFTAYI